MTILVLHQAVTPYFTTKLRPWMQLKPTRFALIEAGHYYAESVYLRENHCLSKGSFRRQKSDAVIISDYIFRLRSGHFQFVFKHNIFG